MILQKEKCSWTCGKNYNITRHGFRYLVRCDNPDCRKEFYRQLKQINGAKRQGLKRQYCSNKCMDTHLVGICKYTGCNEKYTHQSLVRGSANRLCRKHSVREQSRENAIKYRQRDKKVLHDLLGNHCACCGEKDSMYLEIDHVHNDGAAHRTKINEKWGLNHIRSTSTHPRHHLFYLKENPKGLQILCSNCNRAKSKNKGKLYHPKKFTRRSNQKLMGPIYTTREEG